MNDLTLYMLSLEDTIKLVHSGKDVLNIYNTRVSVRCIKAADELFLNLIEQGHLPKMTEIKH